MRGLSGDIRFALRGIRKDSTLSFIVVLTLALVIGESTSLFTLVDELFLKPLPIQDPSGLVALHVTSFAGDHVPFGVDQFENLAHSQNIFDRIAGISSISSIVAVDGRFSPLVVDGVTGNFFQILGIVPLEGRLLEPSDDRKATGTWNPVVIISERIRREAFGNAQRVLGSQLSIQGIPFTVIGVAPKTYHGLEVGTPSDLIVPLQMLKTIEDAMGLGKASVEVDFGIGRLPSSLSTGEASAQLDTLWTHIQLPALERSLSESSRTHLKLDSARTGISDLRNRFIHPLLILLLVSSAALLLACANLASAMLAKNAARSYETGLRVAVGASRWRLIRQLVVESTVLAAIGGTLGVGISFWETRYLIQMLAQLYSVGFAFSPVPDRRVLMFVALVILLVSILISAVPMLHMVRRPPQDALKLGARSVTRASKALGRSLVIVQIAIAIALLEGGAILVGNIWTIYNGDLGFPTDGLVEAVLLPKPGGYQHLNELPYYRQMVDALSAIPGVKGVSTCNFTPAAGGEVRTNVATPLAGDDTSASLAYVSPGFFETIRAPVIAGRSFAWSDRGQNVAVISSGLAKRLFVGRSALNQEIAAVQDQRKTLFKVIGIVSDVRLFDLRTPQPYAIFIPSFQGGSASMEYPVVMIRTALPLASIDGDVRQTIASMGHEFVFSMRTVRDTAAIALSRERILALISGYLSILAIVLVQIGVSGIISFTVSQRTREIALRIALGATPRDTRRLVFKETNFLLCLGSLCGAPAAWGMRQLAISLVGGSPGPIDFAIVPLLILLALTALFFTYFPAQRATKVDPISLLRDAV